MQLRVIAAFILCLAGFIVSILVLTAGTTTNFLEDAYLTRIPFDSYGYRDIYRPVSDYNSSDNSFDWISIHYLSVCFGDYYTDYYGDSIGVTNVICETSYRPGTNDFDVGRAFVTWTIGIGVAGIDLIVFPLFFRGTFHHNGWLTFFLFVSWLFLLVGAILGSIYATLNIDGDGNVGPLFAPLTWTAVGCVFIAWFAEVLENWYQRFTPKGQVISRKYKPPNIHLYSLNHRRLARGMGGSAAAVGAAAGGIVDIALL